MLKFLLALLLVACMIANAAPEVEEAARHNSGLAAKLLDLKNNCGFEERQPSEADVFSVAAIKTVALLPEVDNTTSDRASPSLLWSIGAQYPSSATFRFEPSEECAGHDNTLEIYNPSALRFEEGKLAYGYGNSHSEATLSLEGPNPVPLELPSAALGQADFETLFANLSVWASGKLGIDYSYRRTEWRMVCRPAIGEGGEVGGTYCGCESEMASGSATYEKELLDERVFFVETGPSQEFWVNPPLGKRLDGAQKEQVIFFARRMPSAISALADGKLLGRGLSYKYSVSTGSCGETVVRSYFSPEGNNMALNMSNETVFPFQLVGLNASYLPFYSEFWWNETAGRKEMLLSAEDRFGFADNFSRNFSVRKPEKFSSETAGARQGSDTQPPAYYPQAPKQSPLPSFSALAVLLALPFTFGAIAAIRWLSKLHDK